MSFGYRAVHLDDLYPGRPEVQDVEWIEHVGRNGWIALSANPHMVRTPIEVTAIQAYGARVFSLPSAQYAKETKGLVFGRRWLSILRRSQRSGPCLWRVYFDRPPIKKIP